MAGAEIGEAAAVAAPFVAVAHQDRRQVLAPGDMVEDRARLLTAAQPRNVQVHADDSQPAASDAPRRLDRTARVETPPAARMAFLAPVAPCDPTGRAMHTSEATRRTDN